jgi:hypothetical protein
MNVLIGFIIFIIILIWFISSITKDDGKPTTFYAHTYGRNTPIINNPINEPLINDLDDNNLVKKNIIFINNFLRDITLSIGYYDGCWKSIGWYVIHPKGTFIFNFPENYKQNNIYIYAVSSHKISKNWTGTNYFKINKIDAFDFKNSGYKHSSLTHTTSNLNLNETLYGFQKLNIFSEYNQFNFCEENKNRSSGFNRGDILTNYRGDYDEWTNRMDNLNINGLLSKSQKKRYRKKKNFYKKKRGY